MNIINGGQVSPYFFIGGGMGLRYYFDEDTALIPLFVHARANILDKKISPYFALSIGYTLNASHDLEPVGLLLSPAAGVTFKVSGRVALNVGLSYEMQNIRIDDYDYSYGFRGNNNSKNSGALGIDFGVSF